MSLGFNRVTVCFTSFIFLSSVGERATLLLPHIFTILDGDRAVLPLENNSGGAPRDLVSDQCIAQHQAMIVQASLARVPQSAISQVTSEQKLEEGNLLRKWKRKRSGHNSSEGAASPAALELLVAAELPSTLAPQKQPMSVFSTATLEPPACLVSGEGEWERPVV
ncbi:hypothetical protein AOLI_G00135660 [Acnodon oligacanthus]